MAQMRIDNKAIKDEKIRSFYVGCGSFFFAYPVRQWIKTNKPTIMASGGLVCLAFGGLPGLDREKLFCVKGIYGQDRTYTGPPKQVRIVINQTRVGSCWQYQIGVDAGKQHIMDNLRVKTPGPRYCHFPKRDDYGAGYFSGLLSEWLVHNDKAKSSRSYAMAAFEVLPKNLDAIDRRLKEAGARKVSGPGRG